MTPRRQEVKGRQGRETPAPAVHQAVGVAEAGRRAGGGCRQQRRQEAEDTEEDLGRRRKKRRYLAYPAD